MTRSSYGPEERHLLETAAPRALRATPSRTGRCAPTTRGSADGDRARPALDLLVDIGLLRPRRATTGLLHRSTPRRAVAGRRAARRQRAPSCSTESARWADAFSELGQLFRTSPQSAVSPITEIHGIENINNFIQAAVSDCRSELLTAQPPGRRTATTLAEAEDRDVKALERGVKMRTLYQHSARHSPATREYVADIVARGAEVRTLDEFFNRLIVDGPTGRDHSGAPDDHRRRGRDPRRVADRLPRRHLRAVLGARPAVQPSAATRSSATSPTDVRAMTIRLLVEGHSDPASAKRLGVSTRTYAGYIAALKDEYGVQTRFQLGYAMGRGEVEQPAEPLDA